MTVKSDIEKIDHYANDSGNKEEQGFIYSLFSENEENPEFRDHIRKIWDRYFDESESEPFVLTPVLDRIHHSIGLKNSQREQTSIMKVYRSYSGIAAILLIPILVLTAYLSWKNFVKPSAAIGETTYSTLFAPLGSRIEFSLPDGTKGWLNSGSSLTYSLPFNHNRKLNLKGEAYFNVAHSQKYPFEITSGEAKIKVVGTKFNVSAYPVEKYIEVVLEEGKVEFSHPRISANTMIKPSERIVFENGNLHRSVTDPSKYTAWVEGKLVFRGDPMAEVARRIERWYNVEVDLVDKEIDKYVFRATFENDSLEDVLRVLCMTSPLSYKIIERRLMDNGICQKGKVLLYYKDSNN